MARMGLARAAIFGRSDKQYRGFFRRFLNRFEAGAKTERERRTDQLQSSYVYAVTEEYERQGRVVLTRYPDHTVGVRSTFMDRFRPFSSHLVLVGL